MRYIPHTEGEVRQMLAAIGVDSVADLFSTIPASLRLKRPLNLPEPLVEADLVREFKRLAAIDATTTSHLAFLGGGAYDHFIPAAVDHLISRSEFYTAYTPYQPEISQGTLQAIFEFQTLICQLTGMDQANASMYDGASACAEAILMAARSRKRKKVLLSGALHPAYRATVETYCRYLDLDLVTIPWAADGTTDPAVLEKMLDDQTAGLMVGYPNFFGVIEDLARLAERVHRRNGLLITAVQEPVALGLLKSPGELGADIVVGEGQSFGIPLSFGGPYLGFFAARREAIRSMPGRLVGESVDRDGRRGFVLTLATREQHIRREKATSNICSNQALCALIATVYLSLLGRQGLRRVAEINYAKAAYARRAIRAIDGFSLPFKGPVFNEFVVEAESGAEGVLTDLEQAGILGGIYLGRLFPESAEMRGRFLVCVTEQHSRKDIDALVAALAGGGA